MAIGRFVSGWRPKHSGVAMVIWLFAGGGEAEATGLVRFLERHFPPHLFVRQTPAIRKPGPKPKPDYKPIPRLQKPGLTGESLAEEIARRLPQAFQQGQADLLLVVDDLDCNDPQKCRKTLTKAIDEGCGPYAIKHLIGFAAPELEAWVIADWENTLGKDWEFRQFHQRMRWWLSGGWRQDEHVLPFADVVFSNPENFSQHDPTTGACQHKLSAMLQAAARTQNAPYYSKAVVTPRLLYMASPTAISAKCPQFRRFYHALQNFLLPPAG